MSTKQMEVAEVSAEFLAHLLSKGSKAAEKAKKEGGVAVAGAVMYLDAKIRECGRIFTSENVVEWRRDVADRMSNPSVLNPTQDVGKLFSFLAYFGDEPDFLDAIAEEASYGVLTPKGITKSGKVANGQTKPRWPKVSTLNQLALEMMNDPDRLAGTVTASDLLGDAEAFHRIGLERDGEDKLEVTTVEKSAKLTAPKRGRADADAEPKPSTGEAGAVIRNLMAERDRIQSVLNQYNGAIQWIRGNRLATPFAPLPTLTKAK